MNNKKFLFISLIILVSGLVLSIGLYKKTNPLTGIKMSVDKEEIIEKADKFLKEQEFFSVSQEPEIDFVENSKLLDELQLKYGIEKTCEISREELPLYYWYVFFENQTERWANKLIAFKFDTKGKLISFRNYKPDSLRNKDFSVDEIKEMADSLISNSAFSSAQFSEIMINNPDFYSFKNGRYSKNAEENDEIEIEYSYVSEHLEKEIKISVLFERGNLIKIESDLPIGKVQKSSNDLIQANIIIKIVIVFVTLIISLVALFRRIRSGEIGFRLATIACGIIFVLSFVSFWGQNGNPTFLLKLVNTFLVSILLAGVSFLIWSITEALIREKWPEKLSSFDLIINKQLTHSIIGKNILLGIAAGFLFTGIQSLINYVLLKFYNFSITGGVLELDYFASSYPFMKLSALSMLSTVGLVIPFVGLIPALLAKKIKGEIGIVIVSAFLFGVFRFGLNVDMVHSIVLFTIISFLFVILFLKSDLLTVIIALFVNILFYNILAFYNIHDMTFFNIGLMFGFIVMLFVIYSITTLFSKDKIKEPLILAPHYVRSISERERLIEEINSARDVQNSFLPKKMPVFDGLDISAICKPAVEVGGDYYDFQEISETELGFVIGDVSGKGTKAAFIMTLVKGFIKTLFEVYKNPRDILLKLNNLFMENVSRGNFVTVFIGKIDVKAKTLTFSSAGHNPTIIRKKNGDIIELNPGGMAIGLTKNPIFDSTLEERTICYEPGDLLVTYTDGFTEAKNRKKEEFGLEKFTHLIKIFGGCCSEELLGLLIKHTDRFRGYAQQHDDMTTIIINFDH